jgi:hypothetical protein
MPCRKYPIPSRDRQGAVSLRINYGARFGRTIPVDSWTGIALASEVVSPPRSSKNSDAGATPERYLRAKRPLASTKPIGGRAPDMVVGWLSGRAVIAGNRLPSRLSLSPSGASSAQSTRTALADLRAGDYTLMLIVSGR